MAHTTSAMPETTNGAIGASVDTKSNILETGAAIVQDFSPLKSICAHLNAFHVYADEPHRFVEANHYCTHLSQDVRQCLIYDTPNNPARLIGVEYMVTPRIYATLDTAERKLWHTHVFEVKSGMLVMPQPSTSVLPAAAWQAAETEEMKQVVELYGKTYHFWQVDRGDVLPLGPPKLMMSLTDAEQLKGKEELLNDRDQRFNVDRQLKKQARADIEEPEIHQDADSCWKS